MYAMFLYECKVCGYVYDSRKGDESSGVEKDTDFRNLDILWECPICASKKNFFIRKEDFSYE